MLKFNAWLRYEGDVDEKTNDAKEAVDLNELYGSLCESVDREISFQEAFKRRTRDTHASGEKHYWSVDDKLVLEKDQRGVARRATAGCIDAMVTGQAIISASFGQRLAQRCTASNLQSWLYHDTNKIGIAQREHLVHQGIEFESRCRCIYIHSL